MPLPRSTIHTDDAPAAIGPYSQAVLVDGPLLLCSGQIPLDPQTGEIVSQDVAAQTVRCMESLAALCEAAGARLQDAARLTIYTTQLHSFSEINDAYGAFFDADPPARVTIGVAELPRGAKVEIEAVVPVARP